ncbi:hypothetical protein ABW48_10350 [Pluralibacter gergoviae]|nr:hypothetical protein ABW48_10350 [Pluralibacter gergoviae]
MREACLIWLTLAAILALLMYKITPVSCLFNIATCGGFLFLAQGAAREEIPRVAAPAGQKTRRGYHEGVEHRSSTLLPDISILPLRRFYSSLP